MKYLIACLLTALALFGCSSGVRDDARSAVDPVTDARVGTDSPWKTEWNGTWYYFESEETLKRFRADPTAYVAEDEREEPTRRKVYPHEVR